MDGSFGLIILRKKKISQNDFISTLEQLGNIHSVVEFCKQWNYISSLETFGMNSNLRLFREGILPVWEDPINIEGGKWNITLIFDWKKEAGSIPDRYIRLFLNLLIHLICGQLGYEDVLFGACLSVREYGLQISVWNKFSNDSEQIDTIKMRLADILKQNVEIKYYTHKSTLYYHQEITKTIEGGIKIENFEPKKNEKE